MNASFSPMSFSGCPLPPSLLCLAVSVGLFVHLGCRGEVPVMPHHNVTLLNIDCPDELPSLLRIHSAESLYSNLKIVSDGWTFLLASCLLFLNSLDHVNYSYYVNSLCLHRQRENYRSLSVDLLNEHASKWCCYVKDSFWEICVLAFLLRAKRLILLHICTVNIRLYCKQPVSLA